MSADSLLPEAFNWVIKIIEAVDKTEKTIKTRLVNVLAWIIPLTAVLLPVNINWSTLPINICNINSKKIGRANLIKYVFLLNVLIKYFII